jgi:hypothetical protein
MIEELMKQGAEDIARVVIEAARAGDLSAGKWVLDRPIRPAARAQFNLISRLKAIRKGDYLGYHRSRFRRIGARGGCRGQRCAGDTAQNG